MSANGSLGDGTGRGGTIHRRTATVCNERGLHARAAARFVKLAGTFRSPVTVSRGGQTVSGASILGLMMLAASPGIELRLEAKGPDAQAAIDALGDLIAAGFEEV